MSYKPSDHCTTHVGTKLNWVTGECTECTKEKANMPKDRTRLKQLIERHVRAAVERSWIGSRPPSDHALIESEYRESKRVLEDHINATV